jgi:ABC-2 type transport system permease protein
MREIRERVRGRAFRIGTIILLLGVAAAIVIPTINKHRSMAPQRVCVVGGMPATTQQSIAAAGQHIGTSVTFVLHPSAASGRSALESGSVDLCVMNNSHVVVKNAITADDTSATADLVRAVSGILGIQQAYQAAGITPAQASKLAQTKPVPVVSLNPPSKSAGRATSIVGVIVIFVMLTQYNTWILIGVMQEKSSRVVEVLLATVRPVQLLAGKVLGIGLTAMAQAGLILAFALVLAKAAGSDLLKGTAPLELASALLWLVLGFAFYSWVYAAAGSMAERQDQVQSLAVPLSLPILLGYVLALTVASTGKPSHFFYVLAYLPPTAPFAMPVLVGLGKVSWWQFTASVLISVVCTVALARAAAQVYRRAILRTGRRIEWREVLSRRGGGPRLRL